MPDPINEILQFAIDGTEVNGDVMSLEDYAADEQRLTGNQLGIARRDMVNVVLRQSTHMSAGLAQFIANRHEAGVVDDGDLDKVEAGLVAAITALILAAAPEQATEGAQGLVELATAAEVAAGTDTERAVTPAGLAEVLSSTGANIASVVKSDTWSASVAVGAESGDATGLAVSITPRSAASKLLLMGMLSIGREGSCEGVGYTIYRDGVAVARGDAASSRSRVTGGAGSAGGESLILNTAAVHVLLDSGSTTETTFTVRFRHRVAASKTIYVNRTGGDSDAATSFRAVSTLTVQEVE